MQKSPIEIELKLDLVDESNYLKLLESVRPVSAREQINYFFDTQKKSLKAMRFALRLRFENDRAIITLKGPANKSASGFTERLEIEDEVDQSKARAMIKSGIALSQLPEKIREIITTDRTFLPFLKFTNYRTSAVIDFDNGSLIIEIDKTKFQDQSVDYEAEIEIEPGENQSKIRDRIETLFAGLGIPILYQKESKFVRALKKGGS